MAWIPESAIESIKARNARQAANARAAATASRASGRDEAWQRAVLGYPESDLLAFIQRCGKTE